MIALILSWLFPPALPGRIRDWDERFAEQTTEEQGWAGNVHRKWTGIERHWMTVDAAHQKLWRVHQHQYWAQLHYAQKEMEIVEKALLTQGYINTILDCWEKVK